MLLIKLLVLITHVLMCTFLLTGLLFVSSLQHLELVRVLGYPTFQGNAFCLF